MTGWKLHVWLFTVGVLLGAFGLMAHRVIQLITEVQK